MNKGLCIRSIICIIVLGICLYSYVNKQNSLTKLKLFLPEIQKQIAEIKEENERLKYEIDHFESPAHLMELARHPEFSHLKHPFVKDILTLEEGVALQEKQCSDETFSKSLFPIHVGAK